MTRSRIALFSLGLVLLGVLVVVGAGIYLSQNLPELLRLQAARALQHYGVDDIEYEGLRFSLTDASVDSLRLNGTYENLVYQASVTRGVLHYNWRALLTGEVDSLSLSSLAFSVAHTATREHEDTAATVTVEEFLPPQLLAQLPFQSLRIENWQASYRSPGDHTIDAHGSLIIDQRIELRAQTTLADCTVTGQLAADIGSPELLLKLSMSDAEVSVATLAALLARSTGPGWEWHLQGHAQHAPLLNCLRELEKQHGLTLGIPTQTDLSLTGESVISARIEHPDTLNLAAAPDADDAPLRQLQASVQLDASLTPRLGKHALPRLQLAFTHSGTWEHSELTLGIADEMESFNADLTGTLNPSQGSGAYTLSAHIDDLPYFAATATRLLQHFKLLERSVTIRSGTIKLTTALTSTGYELDNWSQRSQLSADNVSGNFNDYAFDNLDLKADWSGITRWKTLQPLQISVATFNPGIAVRDIQLLVSLPKSTPIAEPQVRIDAFSATVFGGELALPNAPLWDFAAASNSATLTASGWQLGELVALQGNADIQAAGVLEGSLPITIADGRMIIDSGYLRALPPGGHIRYRADADTLALAEGNSELALALELLSDFQYELLSSEVQLDKAGNLLLALSLEGSNPALHEGQAVRFNINVEQNLDPLLQSLRIGDNLERRIEGGLK